MDKFQEVHSKFDDQDVLRKELDAAHDEQKLVKRYGYKFYAFLAPKRVAPPEGEYDRRLFVELKQRELLNDKAWDNSFLHANHIRLFTSASQDLWMFWNNNYSKFTLMQILHKRDLLRMSRVYASRNDVMKLLKDNTIQYTLEFSLAPVG